MYDIGYTDEAIRIATNIRILLHQTKNSTSLLKHLNATTINLLSTSMDYEGDVNDAVRFCIGMVKYEATAGGPFYFLPTLQGAPIKEYIPFSKWWTQPILIMKPGGVFTRRKIILDASNKDGGAHVDSMFPEDYEFLTSPGIMGSFGRYTPNGYVYEEIENTHYTLLRQMAFEILNSPQLTELADV
ncbi:hypothetical protein LRM35_21265 [Klebsiella variicola subsp. variicola]|nr:hypothetical protein LRM35_21265 [Klebsiella variicola subsp. variicola]